MDKKVLLKFVIAAGIIMSASVVGFAWQHHEGAGQEAAVQEASEPEPGVESDAYILARGDYSNLVTDLKDVDKPVYDRYTLKQRQDKGLPTMLPQLEHYTSEKVAYLTFDDGPDNKNTPAILDILKANGIQAIYRVKNVMSA